MTHGCLGRPRPGGRKRDRRRAFAEIAPHFCLERALAQSPSSHGVGRGPSPEVICRGIRPKPREIGIPEVIYGESRQPAPIEGGTIFPDGRERNICHFMDGNRLCANPAPCFGGELATNELYAHFEAGGQPSDGARSGMGPQRDGHGAGPLRFTPKIRLIFRWNGARREGKTGGERARRGRADRVAGPEVRICSIPSQNGALSGPPIGTWSVSRQPAPIGGGTGGPKAQSLWLGVRLMDCRSGEIGGIWQPPRLMD